MKTLRVRLVPMLDSIRYWLAALTVATMPAAILYWYLIHPFAVAWRKLGRLPTYLIVSTVCLGVVGVLLTLRDSLLGADYGFNPALAAAGAILYAVAVYLELQCRKHLKFHILAGAPELAKDDPGRLLQEGIYARIRHPRYLSLLFGMTGVALFMNYRGVYVFLVALAPAIWALILLEERELRARFGEAYVEYSRRVPRLVPRLR